MADKITIAVSADFFSAFSVIPRRQQGKVLTFINRFRTNPEMPGFNYEKIESAKDKRLRSVRIDDTYRCILLKPDKEPIYMLLWVDHHDEAYAWARKRVCSIDPQTGGLQILVVDQEKDAPQQAPAAAPSPLAQLNAATLAHLGIPEAFHNVVCSIQNEDGLLALKDSIPSLSYEALSFLQAGDPLADVLALYDACREEAALSAEGADASMAKALHNPFSLQHFLVDPEEKELASMLEAPLERWRVFLHPSQRSLVARDWNGPVRILGGAGTGKTVVALHRAKWLAENHCAPHEKILFTTFTRTLAVDIARHLKSICEPEILARIEVVNLDKWVSDFLRRHAYEYEIDYGEKTDRLWEKARTALAENDSLAAFPTSFFMDEWKSVIQPQEIMTQAGYFAAQRTGRKQKLTRKQRKDIWPVFEEFRILLNEKRLRQPADAMREARELLEHECTTLYRAVIVDEAQDMSRQAFRLIRALTPEGKNDIFITGDAHQRIYGHQVVLGNCGINITGRGRKLRINYRTTEEIRRTAVSFLTGQQTDDLDGGQDTPEGCISLLHGERPAVMSYFTEDGLYDDIAAHIKTMVQHGLDTKDICIVTRTNQKCETCEAMLQNRQMETYMLSANKTDDRDADGIRLATMHRVKGLEFEVVIMLDTPFLTKEGEACPTKERSLRYVAASRARKHLLIWTPGVSI